MFGGSTNKSITNMNDSPIKKIKKTTSVLDLDGLTGLSEVEAKARLQLEGFNELPAQKNRSLFKIIFEVAREPMFIMLLAAGSLYFLMGEPVDALMLLGFVLVVMAITIIQERRTEHALEALRDLSSPRTLVIRDGSHQRIAGREVARGDFVVLSEGDRVPADGLLRRGINLSADESLLSGESNPVRKTASSDIITLDTPGGDDLPSLFSGTLVTTGQGIIEVTATGFRSELGKIGKALDQISPEPTPLQKEMGRLVRTFAIVGMVACSIVVVAFALTRGGGANVWKEGILAGIAMAMAVLPEEFPVILTIFLALGAWRISRIKVLTRRMPVIETLGSATVLCVDKTGTLTQNQMTLQQLMVDSELIELSSTSTELSESAHNLLECAILASNRDPFDPMERALHEAGKKLIADTEHLHPDWSLECDYPLTPSLLAMSLAWRKGNTDEIVVSAKGAPEAIAELCHMTIEQRSKLVKDVESLASIGSRVLGVARCEMKQISLPDQQHDLALKFVGLIGFQDPLRSTVPAAIGECQTAGIRVVMITGDYPATAQSIARQAGLTNCDNVITGTELNSMTDETLAQRIKDVQVFARVIPEQKLRIVNALKENKEIVAMTGDGVNDAPALKAAHIGIAMGGRGTDVARESASLVLLNDDFSSIVLAVKLGRRIFDNIKKAIAFTLAVHVPIAGLSMIPVFISDWPLLLLPIHIVFLELIIDPSCSLIFEAEDAESNVMKRPPRKPEEHLFSLRTVGMAIFQGVCVLAICIGVFLYARVDHSPEVASAMMFATLVVSFIVIILVNRSWTRSVFAMFRVPNEALKWVVLGTLVILSGVLFIPFAQRLFHFAPLDVVDIVICLGTTAVCFLIFELVKRIGRKYWVLV